MDVLQLVVDAAESDSTEGGYTDADIAIECLTFLGAGSDTTAITLVLATYQLAVNPEVQERLANEIHDYYKNNEVIMSGHKEFIIQHETKNKCIH